MTGAPHLHQRICTHLLPARAIGKCAPLASPLLSSAQVISECGGKRRDVGDVGEDFETLSARRNLSKPSLRAPWRIFRSGGPAERHRVNQVHVPAGRRQGHGRRYTPHTRANFSTSMLAGSLEVAVTERIRQFRAPEVVHQPGRRHLGQLVPARAYGEAAHAGQPRRSERGLDQRIPYWSLSLCYPRRRSRCLLSCYGRVDVHYQANSGKVTRLSGGQGARASSSSLLDEHIPAAHT